MSTTILFPYTTPANYSYDTDLIDVVGGVAKLKDLTPLNSKAWATYTSSINLSGGLGVLTGTGVGSPTISGNKLDLTGDTIKHVDYDAENNADMQQVGAIKFKIIPNYSGAPSSNKGFLSS